MTKEKFTIEDVIALMIWAEENGRHYTGKDKEGQLRQFNQKIDKHFKNKPKQNELDKNN